MLPVATLEKPGKYEDSYMPQNEKRVIKPDCVEEARTQKMNDLETEDAKVESSVPTSPFTIRTLAPLLDRNA